MTVIEIREQIDKERKNNLKTKLPAVCFSGQFTERKDACLKLHSGFICLDFDNLPNITEDRMRFQSDEYVFACWLSPSGNGLKVLIKIANGDKHREHFAALQELYPSVDRSGVNESRVCYESWDSELYRNDNAKIFTTIKQEKKEIVSEKKDSVDVFRNILTWLSNKGAAFVSGERNAFVFRLASACCRFGLDEYTCQILSRQELSTQDNSFSRLEMERTIKSAYKSNQFASAEFTHEKLVDKVTRHEVEIDKMTHDIYNLDIKPKDVIYGEDVKGDALELYERGYEGIKGIGVPMIDQYYKMKRGEITVLSGIGNYGKSSFLKWYLLMRVVKFGEKFALFAPEDNPAHEFYHDMVEIYLGCDCTPENRTRPSKEDYQIAYDFVSKNIFYIYPKDIDPTPEYIKERFLELCIKEKIDGCIIDPFNQMANDYGKHVRTDKYLETFLSDCSRFAQTNMVYFLIVAHPKQLRKEKGEMNYPEPDVFDLADGAMWNNKSDNILIYHRPMHGEDPNNPIATLSSKKIRRQKTVGKKGTATFELNRATRRYWFGSSDPLGEMLGQRDRIELTDDQFEIKNMRTHRSDAFDGFTSDPIDESNVPF